MAPPLASIPPLIPLPPDADADQPPPPTRQPDDPRDDLFATLFTPATPRPSPAHSPPPTANARPRRPHSSSYSHAHARTSSSDSEFGSFVSVPVPAHEDPLAPPEGADADASADTAFVSASTSLPFTPLHNFEFFQDAKAAQDKNKKGVLDELLNNDLDPLYFLRSDTPKNNRASQPGTTTTTTTTSTSASASTSPSPGPSTLADIPPISLGPTVPLTTITKPQAADQPLVPIPPAQAQPSLDLFGAPRGTVLDELLAHQDDPMYFHTGAGKLTTSPEVDDHAQTAAPQVPPPEHEDTGILVELDTAPPSPPQTQAHTPTHPTPHDRPRAHSHTRRPTASPTSSLSVSPSRSPSLPPTAIRISQPEVQRAQSSYFTPSSFGASTFPIASKWVSSFLARPPAAPQAHAEDVLSRSFRSASPLGGAPSASVSTSTSVPATGPLGLSLGGAGITHGTPFAAHPYVPPSGAPGFAGDRAWDKGWEFDRARVERASVRLVGRREGTAGVLTQGVADLIRPHLPALKRLPRAWTLLYSLDEHGISLHTLYARCAAHAGGAVLVVRDARGALFGAWVSEGVRVGRGAYYGSGEAFLWKVVDGAGGEPALKVFRWSGKNDYVALCEPEYISFGGGDGHYGLYLDDTLCDGSSARCPTFENEPLCAPGGPRQGEAVTFECVGLEVWGVG